MKIHLHETMKRCHHLPSIFAEIEIEQEYYLIILTEKEEKVHVLNVTDSEFQSNCNDLHQGRLAEIDTMLSALLKNCKSIQEAIHKIKETTI